MGKPPGADSSATLTQRQRREESSRRLLDAAVVLLAEKGFQQTTATEIAVAAGYSREMVRARFGSKRELLDVLLREQFEDKLIYPPNGSDTGLDQVLERIDCLIALDTDAPHLLRAVLKVGYEAAGADAWLTARIADWFDRATAAIEALIAIGQADQSVLADLDPATEAQSFIAECAGLCFCYIIDQDRQDLAVTLEAWRERVERHLTKAGS